MEININLYMTMGIASIVYLLGRFLKEKLAILQKYCIPSPVIGGFIFALVLLLLRVSGIAIVNIDTQLQSIFMMVFFTSIGFTASLKILKSGGIKVVIFLIVATILIIFQDVLGVALAKVFGLNPLLGLATGSIPMTGGHGTSASFGPLLETKGCTGAEVVAVASATYGLIAGCIVGPICAKILIDKNKIQTPVMLHGEAALQNRAEDVAVDPLNSEKSVMGLVCLFIALGLGSIVSAGIEKLGVTMPAYIGSMLVAAVMVNVVESTGRKLPDQYISTIGSVCLSMFLTLALMSLKLWQLFDLAIPMIVMLLAQTVLMGIYAFFVTYNIMGKGYDGAIFTAAHCGFGMGATPNAIANMDSVCGKYGFTPVPYFVVPIIGGLFIDFTNTAVITTFINIFQ